MTAAGPRRAVPATKGVPRGRPGRPAGRPPLSRTEILAAAALVFRRDGYQSARMEDVAEVLGITKPSLYYYVRTKHELLFDIILPPYRDAVAHLDEVLASPSPAPVRIGEVVARHFGNVARYSPAISIYVENLRSLPVPPEMSQLDARYVRGLRQLIAAGQSDGSLRSCDPAVAADALLGMCNRFAVRYAPHIPFDPDALAATVTSIFLNGVALPGTEMPPPRNGVARPGTAAQPRNGVARPGTAAQPSTGVGAAAGGAAAARTRTDGHG